VNINDLEEWAASIIRIEVCMKTEELDRLYRPAVRKIVTETHRRG
jgi:hypothetical protein